MSDFLMALIELGKLGNQIVAQNQALTAENEKLKAQVAAHDKELKPAPPPSEAPPIPKDEG